MSSYKTLTDQLARCGLSWHHARVIIFIQHVGNRYGRKVPFLPEELPSKACIHLGKILNEYEEIHSIIKRCGVTWNDPVIVNYFAKKAVDNRLKLSQWEELKTLLFSLYMPF